jgi:hypothetical protein
VSDARTAGEGTPVAEAGLNVTALGATRDVVLLAVGMPDSADVVVQAVDVRTWQPKWRTAALPVSHSVSPLALSSTLSWAVYGQSIIDLEDGAVTPLPEGWATTGVTGDVVLGVVDAGAAVAARDGSVLGRAEGILAVGPGGAVGEWLLYVASDGVANRVYAVPRSAVS